MDVTFFVPYNRKKGEIYYLTITSDRWFMREEFEERLPLDDIVMEEDHVDFTDLLDLNPLPTRTLGRIEYESLFKF